MVLFECELCKSNKQLINYLDKLYHTDPSKSNRTLKGLVSALEVGEENEFQILSYLNDLNNSKPISPPKPASFGSTAEIEKGKQEVTSELTYEQAVEASKNKENHEQLIQTHNTVRLWEVLLQLFKDRTSQRSDELMDEEEEASVTVGRERDEKIQERQKKKINDKKEAEKILRKTEKLAKNYIGENNRLMRDSKRQITELHLCQFLVISYVITSIHYFTEYDLAKKKNYPQSYKGYSPDEWKKILRDKYKIIMQDILLSFSKLLIGKKVELIDYSDNENKANKLNEYAQKVLQHLVLYHYLINVNTTDNPRVEFTDLACLSIFQKMGLPNNEIDEYMEKLSKTNHTTHFNYLGPLRVKERLLGLFRDVNCTSEYFSTPVNGVCRITKQRGDVYLFHHVFDPIGKRSIKESALKKYMKSNGK